MLTEERHDIIRQHLTRSGRVVAADLAAEFGVSEDTVRRDLRELAKSGFCRKVYGGALIAAPAAGPVATRLQRNGAEKAALAAQAAGLVQDGQTLFIDAGTTNVEIAQRLPRGIDLTVVTNAPGVVLALAAHDRARVLLLGGLVAHDTGAATGGATLAAIRQVQADLFFLGSCGVDTGLGITAFDPAEAEIKRAMVDQSAAVVVAATLDKLATVAPFRVAPAEAMTHLVLSGEAEGDLVAGFRAAGTTVHLVA